MPGRVMFGTGRHVFSKYFVNRASINAESVLSIESAIYHKLDLWHEKCFTVPKPLSCQILLNKAQRIVRTNRPSGRISEYDGRRIF